MFPLCYLHNVQQVWQALTFSNAPVWVAVPLLHKIRFQGRGKIKRLFCVSFFFPGLRLSLVIFIRQRKE